jgi:hypothetical protein
MLHTTAPFGVNERLVGRCSYQTSNSELSIHSLIVAATVVSPGGSSRISCPSNYAALTSCFKSVIQNYWTMPSSLWDLYIYKWVFILVKVKPSSFATIRPTCSRTCASWSSRQIFDVKHVHPWMTGCLLLCYYF